MIDYRAEFAKLDAAREDFATAPDWGDNLVDPQYACPQCGERDADELVWQDDDTVWCAACGHRYVRR